MPQLLNLKKHAYVVEVSGYTVLPGQVGDAELEKLRACSERALATAHEFGQQPKTLSTEYYRATRCLYLWGEPFLRLLEHQTVHALASLLMGKSYLLWDLSVLAALPAPPRATEQEATTAWHRDWSGIHCGSSVPGYLWFFVCLDDVTSENGATWVVPGSHRVLSRFEPGLEDDWCDDGQPIYPSAFQVTARAGDILVLNPAMLHNSGHNRSDKPRRLLNIGLCHADLDPLMDHWAIAGGAIQRAASSRLCSLLGADRCGPDRDWPVRPKN